MSKYIIPRIDRTPDHDARLISFMQTIQKLNAIAEVANIEITATVTDVKFKGNIPLNNAIRNLKASTESIRLHLAEYGNVKDRKDFDNEFALAMWRVVDLFSGMGTEQINSFVDGVEESNK